VQYIVARVSQDVNFINGHSVTIANLAPYKPELARKIMKQLKSQGDKFHDTTGYVAAMVGDTDTARRP
jgi:hypothetical protein